MTSGKTEGIHLSSCCVLAWWSSIDCWQRWNIRTDDLLILCLLIHNNRYCEGKKPPIFITVTFLGQVTCKGIYDRVACDNKRWIHWLRHFPSPILMNQQKSNKKIMMSVSCSYAFWVPWNTSLPLETTWNPREYHICGTRLIDSANSPKWNLSSSSQTKFWDQLDAPMMPFPLTHFSAFK